MKLFDKHLTFEEWNEVETMEIYSFLYVYISIPYYLYYHHITETPNKIEKKNSSHCTHAVSQLNQLC